MLTSSNADPAFTKMDFLTGKMRWRKRKDFKSTNRLIRMHMEAVARYVTAPATVIGDIGDLLSERHALEKSKNKKIFLSQSCPTIRYLARQALPLRRDWNTETMSEENSSFHQLLKLRGQENPEIIEWLRKRDGKYPSPAIQNEMLKTRALGMMRQISANIQNATFFTIMADETAGVSNKEPTSYLHSVG